LTYFKVLYIITGIVEILRNAITSIIIVVFDAKREPDNSFIKASARPQAASDCTQILI
jgi:hypothetical protein